MPSASCRDSVLGLSASLSAVSAVITAHMVTSHILGNGLLHDVVRGVTIFGGGSRVATLVLCTLFHASNIILDVLLECLLVF